MKASKQAKRNQLECDSIEDLRLEKLLKEQKDKVKRKQDEKKHLEQRQFEELTSVKVDRMEGLIKMIASSLEGMREEQRNLNLKIHEISIQTVTLQEGLVAQRRNYDLSYSRGVRFSRGERDFIDE